MQSPHSLRLCHIYKWDHFEGYGFNLHAEKGKPGQYIGKVDEGSPAEAAGLKEGDRIIEVNGINIAQDNHKQVVQRIKALKSETKLLVVDAESELYFKSQNITLHGGLSCIITMTTPLTTTTAVDPKNHNTHDTNDGNNLNQKIDKTQEFLENEAVVSVGQESMIAQPNENGNNHEMNNPKKEDKQTKTNSLRLNMTAKELRAQLAARPRYDPKTDSSIDLRKKYDIVQKL
uniref:Putative na+/h+ exchange regulatory cofactor nhe-rf1-like protein n=1 Tax=Triatoma infestans TaxID=30076 RepID=A0A023F7J4_TRIIF